MDTTSRDLILQRYHFVRHDLLPELRNDFTPLPLNLEMDIYNAEWVRIEECAYLSN